MLLFGQLYLSQTASVVILLYRYQNCNCSTFLFFNTLLALKCKRYDMWYLYFFYDNTSPFAFNCNVATQCLRLRKTYAIIETNFIEIINKNNYIRRKLSCSFVIMLSISASSLYQNISYNISRRADIFIGI